MGFRLIPQSRQEQAERVPLRRRDSNGSQSLASDVTGDR